MRFTVSYLFIILLVFSVRERHTSKKERKNIKDKEWVLRKKEQMRRRGKKVAADSKYTARKRGPKF
jgi:18S rRNA (guanine1575-N7)-methyltransferase